MKNNTSGKKVREAAALQYSPLQDGAPKIIALGKGDVAEKIIETARENEVPVYEDSSLAGMLNALSVGDEIPKELYSVVAEILIFVSSMDKEYGEKYGSK